MRGIGSARWLVVGVALLLGACASPYATNTLIGGFREQPLGPNTVRLSYSGNGYTDEEQVVSYWLHRAAELTVQHGYSYFGMVPGSDRPTSRAEEPDEATHLVTFREPAPAGVAAEESAGAPRMVHVKSGGGYIYVPSFSTYNIRTWSKHGTIVMYHSRIGALTSEQAYSLHARTVLEKLGEYVKSGAKVKPPPRGEVIDAAARFSPIQGTSVVDELPATTVTPPVK